MADYKAMYLAAMDAMERAIETLTAASRDARTCMWPPAGKKHRSGRRRRGLRRRRTMRK